MIVAIGMLIVKIPIALPSSSLLNHCGTIAGVTMSIREPPIPRMSLAIRSAVKELDVAVMNELITTQTRATPPVTLAPYLSIAMLTGMLRMIPGRRTNDMRSPASALLTLNSCTIAVISGGTTWNPKA